MARSDGDRLLFYGLDLPCNRYASEYADCQDVDAQGEVLQDGMVSQEGSGDIYVGGGDSVRDCHRDRKERLIDLAFLHYGCRTADRVRASSNRCPDIASDPPQQQADQLRNADLHSDYADGTAGHHVQDHIHT